MTTTTFLILLSAFSVISGLVVEGIKKIISDKANLSYNLVALIISSSVTFSLQIVRFSLTVPESIILP